MLAEKSELELEEYARELETYWDMLSGREPLPIDNGVLSLMESATEMYTRAAEISKNIHRLQRKGHISGKDALYKFRTGELRDFMEQCSKQIELGSRRMTAAKNQFEMTREGIDIDFE